MLAAVPHGDVPADGAPVVVRGTVWVEELALHRVGGRLPNSPQAKIRWRADDAQVNGRPVRMEGEGDLYSESTSGGDWQLEDVRITCMEPRDGGLSAQAPALTVIPPKRVAAPARLRHADRPGPAPH
jgi:hypothetical protein